MGGTFRCLPEEYRDNLIQNLHGALSGHSSSSEAEAAKYSEKSRTKCIGSTIETRPDIAWNDTFWACCRMDVQDWKLVYKVFMKVFFIYS